MLFTATLGVIAGTKGYAAYSHDGVISSTIASRRGVIRTDLGRVTVRNDYGCEPRPTIPHCMLKDSLGDYVVFTGGCCPGGSSGGPFNPLFPNEPGDNGGWLPPLCVGLTCSPPFGPDDLSGSGSNWRKQCFAACINAANSPQGPCYHACHICYAIVDWPTLVICLGGCAALLWNGWPEWMQQSSYRVCVTGCFATAFVIALPFCPYCAGCMLSYAWICADVCGY